MFMKKKKYDLIFSLGEACSCTETLRAAKIQHYSYPLDWLYGSDFLGRVNILISEFQDFIKKEDLVYVGNRIMPQPCDIYFNKKNGITFNHDFPLNVPLEEAYDNVKCKYDRRIKRLFQHISKSKKVLIVYIETPNCKNMLDNSSLLDGSLRIKNYFKNCEIDILYLTNNLMIPFKQRKVEILDEYLTKISFNYKSHKQDSEEYVVNLSALKQLFNNYQIKYAFWRRIFVQVVKIRKILSSFCKKI